MTENESRTKRARERERDNESTTLVLPVEGEEHGKAVVCVSIVKSGKRESLSRDVTSSAPLILLL